MGLFKVVASESWSVIHWVPQSCAGDWPQPWGYRWYVPKSMFGSAVSRALSTPSVMLYGKLPAVPPTPGWKPSSPTDTRWLRSMPLMNVDISSAHPVNVSAVQVPEVGSEALMQR